MQQPGYKAFRLLGLVQLWVRQSVTDGGCRWLLNKNKTNGTQFHALASNFRVRSTFPDLRNCIFRIATDAQPSLLLFIAKKWQVQIDSSNALTKLLFLPTSICSNYDQWGINWRWENNLKMREKRPRSCMRKYFQLEYRTAALPSVVLLESVRNIDLTLGLRRPEVKPMPFMHNFFVDEFDFKPCTKISVLSRVRRRS